MAQTTTPPFKAEEPPQLMTKAEAAAYLRISLVTLTKYVGLGRIPSVRLGKMRRFHRNELERIAREGF